MRNIASALRPEMQRLYESGLHQSEVAQRLGIGQATVSRHLRSLGTAMRPTGPRSALRLLNLHGVNESRRPIHAERDGDEGKVCKTCREWVPLGQFYRSRTASDGLEARCKQCCQARALAYHHANSERISAARRTPEHRERFNSYYSKWDRQRRASDTNYRLKRVLRSRLLLALNGRRKAASTLDLLGCSIDEFRAHLEAQFAEGMTWSNHGQPGWEIDHIRPCASFDLTDPEQQRACFHFTNLQPLWGPDNWRKGAR